MPLPGDVGYMRTRASIVSVTAGRAEMLVDLGRWREAFQVLAPLLADPDAGAREWYLLARIRLGQSDLHGAKEAAERAVAVDPADALGHWLLALVLVDLGQAQRALREARQAVALAPASSDALYALVMVLIDTQVRKYAEAEAVATELRRLHAHDPRAWAAAGWVALVRRRWAEAEAHVRRALAIDPTDERLLMLLSRVLEQGDRRSEATAAAVSAVRSDPRSRHARLALGRLAARPVGLGAALGLALVLAGAVALGRWRSTAVGGSGGLLADPAAVAGLLAVLGAVAFLANVIVRDRRSLARMDPDLSAFVRRTRRANSRLPLLGMCGIGAVASLAYLDSDPRVGAVGLAGVALGVLAALGWTHRRGS